MIKVLIGDLFESQAQTLVNTVNCVGVMGKGIALGFKQRFPEMYEDYVKRCAVHDVRLGKPYLYKTLWVPWILNFPTKDHWRSVATLQSIIEGLEYLQRNYRSWGVSSLAVPPLGCGEGQLEWRIVGPTLYSYLDKLNIPVELFAPYGTPHEQLQPGFLSGVNARGSENKMPDPKWVDPGIVALVEILDRLDKQPYHWPVGRTIFQKIAYVATEQGIRTNLDYRRGSYGPFAPKLRSCITRLVNNGLIREMPLGRNMLMVKTGPTFGDAQKAYSDELKEWDPIIERVTDLFLRMNTRQAELVSTVLYAARSPSQGKLEDLTEHDVVKEVLEWKVRRKPAFGEEEVASTVRNLGALGWLDVRASDDLPSSC